MIDQVMEIVRESSRLFEVRDFAVQDKARVRQLQLLSL